MSYIEIDYLTQQANNDMRIGVPIADGAPRQDYVVTNGSSLQAYTRVHIPEERPMSVRLLTNERGYKVIATILVWGKETYFYNPNTKTYTQIFEDDRPVKLIEPDITIRRASGYTNIHV